MCIKTFEQQTHGSFISDERYASVTYPGNQKYNATSYVGWFLPTMGTTGNFGGVGTDAVKWLTHSEP